MNKTYAMSVLAALAGLLLMATTPARAAEPTAGGNPWHRLYPGVTLLLDNPDGKGFEFSLDVQDLNLLEAGPREVLVKVYQPDGTTAVREVIPDDGITSGGILPAYAAWDHEGWYYGYCYATGSVPAFRFSMPTEPDQIAQRAKRTFKWKVPGGTKGVYRAVVVGSADHLIKVGTSTNLSYAVAGNDNWLHAGPGQYKKSYFLVPQDATKLHLMFIEYDQPNNRGFAIKEADGKVVVQGTAQGAFNKVEVDLTKTPGLAGKVLSFEVPDGKNACMFHLAMVLPKPAYVRMRGSMSVNAAMAPTPELAQKAGNGAIVVDGVRFWQPWQPALHKWATSLSEADVTPMVDGKPAVMGKPLNGFAGVTQMDNFQNSNGPHWRAPACDVILFNWAKNKNKQELNYALRDLAQGLLAIGPNDHVAAGPIANLGYEFSNYAYQYWRPSWRVLTQIKGDVPAEVVQGVSQAMITGGDRLAFCREWPRVNGNAFAQVVGSLRYCSVATGDAMQVSLYETFRDRFINGGWGERAGVGPSGFVQEGFGYDHHYGSYILETWPALLADVPEPTLQKTFDRVWNGYTYTCSISTYGVPKGGPKDPYRHYAANPWSSRTHMAPAFEVPTEGPRRLKALPGPDFTETVNEGNELFAARRPSYYALTYHGRLSPEYAGYGFDGEIGYGGGALCQLYVPEKGLVIASTVNDSYGHGMARSNWRNFHLHSLMGTMADGRALVTAASEHPDAKLTGTTVTSTGEVRGANVKVKRAYTFENGKIQCEMGLMQSGYDAMFQLWKPSPERTTVAEAYEMIPFYNPAKPAASNPATKVTAEGADLTDKPVKTQKVTIDRGGFGVHVNLPAPMNVSLGKNNTVLLHVVEKATPATGVGLKYELEVFGK